MKPTEALRDAAILVALVLLATSVRVTDLAPAPLGPETHAGGPASSEPVRSAPMPAAAALPAGPGPPVAVDVAPGGPGDCLRLHRLTVNGPNAERVVVEIDLDPTLRSALGLCPEPTRAPATCSDKA